jgi:hypothetical protein
VHGRTRPLSGVRGHHEGREAAEPDEGTQMVHNTPRAVLIKGGLCRQKLEASAENA